MKDATPIPIGQGERDQKMPTEKRNLARQKRRLRIRFGVAENELERIAHSSDVSPNGFFVATRAVLKPGSYLWFQLDLPDGEILLHGEVIWQKLVDRELWRIEASGFGVKIHQAPERWYQFFLSLDKPKSPPDLQTSA